MKHTVVGLGEILWDVFPDKRILGGAPANFAYHASQLGCDSYIVSARGYDRLGEEIVSNLKGKNLNCLVNTVDYPTGVVQVSLDNNGTPQYEIKENVAWDNIPFTLEVENLAKNTQAVCFGTLAQRSNVSKNTISRFLSAMPKDSLKIFDINLRQHFYTKETIDESLKTANILKINDDEILVLADLYGAKAQDEQPICRLLQDKYRLDIVILTKGTNGSFIFTRENTSSLPTPKVHVADTVGAGDSFTAAFTAAYMHGRSIAEAHRLAVDVSAYVCTQHGAMPELPDTYTCLFR